MLVRSTIFNKIDRIIDLAYLTFAFDLIGDEFMNDAEKRELESLGYIVGHKPLIEVLYTLIRLQPPEGYHNRRLQDLIDNIATRTHLPVFSDTHQAALDQAKLAINNAVQNAKSDTKKQIRQAVLDTNKQYRNDVAVHRYRTVPIEEQKGKDYFGMLLDKIAFLPLLIQSDFVRSFTTALTDSINDTIVDKITEESMLSKLDPASTLVFKKVNNDGSLCQWCGEFYGIGEPKIYTLAQLQANGSNYGKPKSEWKPVIGSTHPRCRCELHVKR